MQRGRDSNPRYSYPYTNFPGWPLQPLGHLSKIMGAKISIFHHNKNFYFKNFSFTKIRLSGRQKNHLQNCGYNADYQSGAYSLPTHFPQ